MCFSSNANCFSGSVSNKKVSNNFQPILKKKIFLPFDPDRRSTPMTCKFKPKLTKQTLEIENSILHITNSRNVSILKKFIHKSLESIQNVFYKKEENAFISSLSGMVENLCVCDMIFLFYALLNVDAYLKNELFKMEPKHNRPKLCRFLLDLRKLFVNFMTKSQTMTLDFINQCEEAYVIA